MSADDAQIEVEVEEGEQTDLTPREELFIYAYADPESATFGQRTKSAAAAQYSQPRSAGLKLVRRPRIKARLALLHDAATASMGQVMANLEHIRLLAVEKGDLRVAARCAELQGRHLGGFSDIVHVDVEARREYTEAEQIEAARLSKLLLTDGAEGQSPPVLSPSDTDAPAVDAGREDGHLGG